MQQKDQINTATAEKTVSDAENHHLIGGALCLDFANTLYGHSTTPVHEYLFNYRDLVLWSRHAGVLNDSDAASLLRIAARQPNEALAVFHHAIALRETLFRFFDAVAHGAVPSTNDLSTINSARIEALAHSQIIKTETGFAMTWKEPLALERMVWHIVLSTAELMTSDKLHLVRGCAGDTCDWLFIDTSRNHLRRWCSMRECGNRAKVRRFLTRKRLRLKNRLR